MEGSARTFMATFEMLFFGVIFIGSGILICMLQLVIFLLVKPWSASAFRKINYYLSYVIYAELVFWFEWWSRGEVYLYVDETLLPDINDNKSFINISNHSYENDFFVGFHCFDKLKLLGNTKGFLKNELKYAPVIGLSWLLQENIFVKRDWNKDRENIEKKLNVLNEYEAPFALVLFPEGTRFTKEKHEASLKFSQAEGLPPLKHHLMPRKKGFSFSVPIVKKKVPNIIDCTISYADNNAPSLIDMMNRKKSCAHVLIQRIPTSEVPDDYDEAGSWLLKLFQEKDARRDHFEKTGKFYSDDDERFKGFRKIQFSRRPYPLLITLFFSIVTLSAMVSGIIKILFYSTTYSLLIISVLFVLFIGGILKLVSSVTIGSSYGKKH